MTASANKQAALLHLQVSSSHVQRRTRRPIMEGESSETHDDAKVSSQPLAALMRTQESEGTPAGESSPPREVPEEKSFREKAEMLLLSSDMPNAETTETYREPESKPDGSSTAPQSVVKEIMPSSGKSEDIPRSEPELVVKPMQEPHPVAESVKQADAVWEASKEGGQELESMEQSEPVLEPREEPEAIVESATEPQLDLKPITNPVSVPRSSKDPAPILKPVAEPALEPAIDQEHSDKATVLEKVSEDATGLGLVSKCEEQLEPASKSRVEPEKLLNPSANQNLVSSPTAEPEPILSTTVIQPAPASEMTMKSEPISKIATTSGVPKVPSEPGQVLKMLSKHKQAVKTPLESKTDPETPSNPTHAPKNQLVLDTVSKPDPSEGKVPRVQSDDLMDGITRPQPVAPSEIEKGKTPPDTDDMVEGTQRNGDTYTAMVDAATVVKPVDVLKVASGADVTRGAATVPSTQDTAEDRKAAPTAANQLDAEKESGDSQWKDIDMQDIEDMKVDLMEEDRDVGENVKGDVKSEVQINYPSQDVSGELSHKSGKDETDGKRASFDEEGVTETEAAKKRSLGEETVADVAGGPSTKRESVETEKILAVSPLLASETSIEKPNGLGPAEALSGSKTEARSSAEETAERVLGPAEVLSSGKEEGDSIVPREAAEDTQTNEEDTEMTDVPRKRPRRSSVRNSTQPRSTRSSRSTPVNASVAAMAPTEKAHETSALPTSQGPDKELELGEAHHVGAEVRVEQDGAELPRPTETPDGMQMQVGESLFVTVDKLIEMKQARIKDKKLKPIEDLTFEDIRGYNRDQLRCFCYIYGTPRRKKIEMEADMARYVSLWNEGRPGYVFSDYVPNNPRNNVATLTTVLMAASGSSRAVRSETSGDGGDQEGEGAIGKGSASVANTSANGDAKISEEAKAKEEQDKKSTVDEATAVENSATDKPAMRKSTGSVPKTPSSVPAQSSARRIPSRASAAGNLQSTSIKKNLASRTPSVERHPSISRGSSPAAMAPNSTQLNPTKNQNGTVAPGTTPGSTVVRSSNSKVTKMTLPIQALPKGHGTSFKQKVHARTAGAKYKAAYNGAGPAIVNIVENAAAYFEGKDSPETLSDQAKSFERYQFNVELLSEIFDGAPLKNNTESSDAGTAASGLEDIRPASNSVLRDVAKRMRSRTRDDMAVELHIIAERYKNLESETKVAERANMRMFQRLERAETEEEIEAVKRDFEREHNVRFEDSPPPLVRRKLDKSLPPLVMPDDQCRILRFKVA